MNASMIPTKNHIRSNFTEFYSKVNKFRISEKYTDVNIRCEDETYRCHRLTLSAASEYFDTMFSGSFKESKDEDIVLHDIDKITFQEVLRFAYRGNVIVTNNNVYNLLQASELFRLTFVENRCIQYLQRSIPSQDAIEIFMFACATNKESLIDIMSRYILNYIHYFSKKTKFLEISFTDLKIMLTRFGDWICKNENVLLDAVTRWVHYSQDDRKDYFEELIKQIQFKTFSMEFILNFNTEYSVDCNEGSDSETLPVLSQCSEFQLGRNGKSLYVFVNTPCTDKFSGKARLNANVLEYRKNEANFDWFFTCRVAPTLDCNVRYTAIGNDHLYYLKSWRSSNSTIPIETFNMCSSIEMFPNCGLKCPPFLLLHKFDICTLQNSIYLYNQNVFCPTIPRTTTNVLDSGFSDEELSRGICVYNCEVDRWFPVPSPKIILSYSCITADNNRVYMVGGSRSKDARIPGYFQAYDHRSSHWDELPRSQHDYVLSSCCVHKGKVYVVGGDHVTETTEVYDPVAGKWELLQSIRDDRNCSRLLSYDDHIWAFFTNSHKLSVHSYNPPLGRWKLSRLLPRAIKKLFPPAVDEYFICNNDMNTGIMDATVFKSWDRTLSSD